MKEEEKYSYYKLFIKIPQKEVNCDISNIKGGAKW